MWDNLRKSHPRLYEATEWLCLILSSVAFGLSVWVALGR